MRVIVAAIALLSAIVPSSAADVDGTTQPARSGFDGSYLSVGGGYGVSGSRSFTMSASVPSSFLSFASASVSDTATPSGWSLIGSAGYNLTFGWTLLGIEADGRWSQERAKFSGTGSFFAPLVIGPPLLSYTLDNDAAAHLAIRFGGYINDTMIFAKVGGGVVRIKETFTADMRNLAGCSAVTSTFSFTCAAFAFGSQGSLTSERWVPSLLFGIGIEHNFNRFFARLSGEIETFAPNNLTLNTPQSAAGGTTLSAFSSSDFFWTARALGQIGFRF